MSRKLGELKANGRASPDVRAFLAEALAAGKLNADQALRIETLVSKGALQLQIAVDRVRRRL